VSGTGYAELALSAFGGAVRAPLAAEDVRVRRELGRFGDAYQALFERLHMA